MAKPSHRTTTSTSGSESTIVRTSGEIFDDGSVIELVSSPTDSQIDLLFWHKHRKTIAPQIEHCNRVYQAPDLDKTLLRAIHFPMKATDYGTDRKLFTEVIKLFERYIGSPKSDASLLTAWSCSAWFQDCVAKPPTLLISGPDMGPRYDSFSAAQLPLPSFVGAGRHYPEWFTLTTQGKPLGT